MVTGRTVVGVSALDALAIAAFDRLTVPSARLGAWMDAARGEVFAASYEVSARPGDIPALAPRSEPEVDAPQAVWGRWQMATGEWVLTGDGAALYRDLLAGAEIVSAPALAPAVGRLGRRMAAGGRHHPHELQPLYVRRPDAERSRQP
jgi:tRNA A37 threonylcarbamoyladenosine modification protein TsaB